MADLTASENLPTNEALKHVVTLGANNQLEDYQGNGLNYLSGPSIEVGDDSVISFAVKERPIICWVSTKAPSLAYIGIGKTADGGEHFHVIYTGSSTTSQTGSTTGTTGPDGSLNIFFDTGAVIIENRSGQQINLSCKILQ